MSKEIVNYKGHTIEYGCFYGECGWVINGYGTIYFTLDGAKEEVDEWIEEDKYFNSLSEDERNAFLSLGDAEYNDN